MMLLMNVRLACWLPFSMDLLCGNSNTDIRLFAHQLGRMEQRNHKQDGAVDVNLSSRKLRNRPTPPSRSWQEPCSGRDKHCSPQETSRDMTVQAAGHSF